MPESLKQKLLAAWPQQTVITKRVTIREYARRIGIPLGTLQHLLYDRVERQITADTRRALAKKLGSLD